VSEYWGTDAEAESAAKGTWVQWDAQAPVEMLPGLLFQPVVGEGAMVNFVRFEPNTVAPVHSHDEEQIAFVLEGEVEYEVAGEVHVLRRGEAVVIPPRVPHGARTRESSCLQVDVFHPPRRQLLDLLER